MYHNFQSFIASMRGKRVAFLGVGVSNTPLIELLSQNGAQVLACDKNEELLQSERYLKLQERGVSFRLGEGYLDDLGCDVIFKSPGIRFDLPLLCAARENGALVTSEMEVFFEICPCKIIGVTGSDGKTTTTTLIARLLEASGHRVHLGGNIGKPLLNEVPSFEPDDIVVVELSSFQLHTIQKSPDVAVVTNVTPNHLDMHKSMEEYVAAKANIFRHQDKDDTLVLNYDNAITRDYAKAASSEVIFFSRKDALSDGLFLRDGAVYRARGGHTEKLLCTRDILLPGMHNVENYMAAIAACGSLITPDAILKTAKTFGGVEHRIELVREVGGVKYYNSSIDSSPARSCATLSVFLQKVIMIAGGKDKNIPYDALGGAILKHVKALILVGATADKIEAAVNAALKNAPDGQAPDIYRCDTYPQVVETAHAIAKPEDIVVLSPASTSFDMFKNFEERGRLYKQLVMGIN